MPTEENLNIVDDDDEQEERCSPEERHEQIANLAYHLWESRGGGHSNPEDRHEDWVTAEERWEKIHRGHHHHDTGTKEDPASEQTTDPLLRVMQERAQKSSE